MNISHLPAAIQNYLMSNAHFILNYWRLWKKPYQLHIDLYLEASR